MSSVACHVQKYENINGYTEYFIKVVYNGYEWGIRKRYSDFVRIDDYLRNVEGYEISYVLPEKNFWSRFDPFLINTRMGELQAYLDHLIGQALTTDNALIREFLEVDENLLEQAKSLAKSQPTVDTVFTDHLTTIVKEMRNTLLDFNTPIRLKRLQIHRLKRFDSRIPTLQSNSSYREDFSTGGTNSPNYGISSRSRSTSSASASDSNGNTPIAGSYQTNSSLKGPSSPIVTGTRGVINYANGTGGSTVNKIRRKDMVFESPKLGRSSESENDFPALTHSRNSLSDRSSREVSTSSRLSFSVSISNALGLRSMVSKFEAEEMRLQQAYHTFVESKKVNKKILPRNELPIPISQSDMIRDDIEALNQAWEERQDVEKKEQEDFAATEDYDAIQESIIFRDDYSSFILDILSEETSIDRYKEDIDDIYNGTKY